MYSIFHNNQEYEVTEELFLQVGMCLLQYGKALVVDKHLFINLFKEKYLPKILSSPKFDYSRMKDDDFKLEGVISTQEIVKG